MVQAGWVDPQAHGVVHNIHIGEFPPTSLFEGSWNGSIEAIEKWLWQAPDRFIWPGGGFPNAPWRWPARAVTALGLLPTRADR